MNRIAQPSLRCRSFSRWMICTSSVASRAVVGSSAISSAGSVSSAIAIATRWRIPPENWWG